MFRLIAAIWILRLADTFLFQYGKYHQHLGNEVGVSFHECKGFCDTLEECGSVSYSRRYQICTLYNTSELNIREPDVYIYKKAGQLHEQQKLITCSQKTYKSLNDSCLFHKRCKPPPAVNAAFMFGNLLSVGSKVKYSCLGSSDSVIITCQVDLSWSRHDLSCVCQVPAMEHGNFRLLRTGKIITANVTCDSPYQLVKNVSPSCDIESDKWTPDIYHMCCDVLNTPPWTKVFKYPGSKENMTVPFPILEVWRKKKYEHDENKSVLISHNCSFYSDLSVIRNWTNAAMKIKKVRLDLIKGNSVVAFLLFNGTNTNKWDWFSQRNLLNSSWADLNPDEHIGTFKLKGNVSPIMRFVVTKETVTDSNKIQYHGWMLIAWNRFTLGQRSRSDYPIILYALNGTSSTFEDGVAAIADRMEIWVQLDGDQ